MTMAESIMVLITRGPYGTEDAFAGLTLALASKVSHYVPRVGVLLVGDGTLNGLWAQSSEAIDMPTNLEYLLDLLDLDVEVCCVKEDLRSRVGGMKILDGIKFVDWAEARRMMEQYQLVTTF